MATYNKGSKGTEVKKLQQALVGAGYDVGATGADGVYGSNTAAAVKKYQQDNGLTVDGVAGDETLGKLYASYKPETHAANANKPTQTITAQKDVTPKSPAGVKPSYSSASDAAYQQALTALQDARKDLPTYASTYDQQLDDIYNQIVNRDKFSYDLNADVLYQQYADQYTLRGELASMDTMGQAAALTGGYGNSYAQNVGQQAYQSYLQQLNDVIPELYDRAYDRYNAEGEDLYRQYSMTGDLAETEYGRYQDALDRYWQNVSYLKDEADDAYDRSYNEWLTEYEMGIDADNRAYERQLQEDETKYNRQQNSYDRLVSLITSTGYAPTEEELMEAGMSEAQAKAYANYYADQNAPKYSGGGGGGSSSDGSSTKKVDPPKDGKNPDPYKALGIKEEPAEKPYNIEDDLNHFISQGASKSEINSFLREALESGVITQAQYNSLKKTYAPAGNTY